MKAYSQSGQYHTIVESRVRLTWYQSHALNLVEQGLQKEKGVKPPRRYEGSKKWLRLQRSRASIKGRRALFEERCWMMKIPHRLI